MFDLYQVTVRCADIPLNELAKAAETVEAEFRYYCPWHRNVRCWIEGVHLIVRGQSEFDADGDALADDLRCCLRDAVSSYGEIDIVSVEPLPDPPLSGVLRPPDPPGCRVDSTGGGRGVVPAWG
jgi:hypothetical protein